ncbi:MAG: MotA/TolQ/ExbB proton channel family protein [Planctomycetota bacterium]
MNALLAANAIEPAVGWFDTLVAQAVGIWVAGGWAMIPIAITALVMFGLGLHVWLSLLAKGWRAVPEQVWRLWIEHPRHREGPLGELLDTVTAHPSLDHAAAAFAGIRTTELAGCQRDLKVMKVCIAVAPLLGLLGTVTGMLATFDALATGAGGDQTMAAIARGISEALITTETGLVVALPGMFFQYQLLRQKERLAAFLAHLETVCTQHLHRVLARPSAA